MEISVREMNRDDITKVVNYFVNADPKFLYRMGADKNKLPRRDVWIKRLISEVVKPYSKKDFYYIIWELNGKAVGHSNVNYIDYGVSATMHLHLWQSDQRKKGLGLELLKLTIPHYFKNLELKKLVCEPYSENVAPNKTIKKLGFTLVKTYETIPGWINFYQKVNRYELTKEAFNKIFDPVSEKS